jgi:hypothetical protein
MAYAALNHREIPGKYFRLQREKRTSNGSSPGIWTGIPLPFIWRKGYRFYTIYRAFLAPIRPGKREYTNLLPGKY